MKYTEADVDRLSERLTAANLGTGEQQALHALVGFAAQHPSDLDGLADGASPAGLKHVLRRVLLEPAPA